MYLISDGGVNSNIPDTIEAIMLTKNINNIDGVKLDVRTSLDNVFVLSKYNDLSKLTCSNRKVDEVNYSYLKKVRFPSHLFKYYIPTLEEILKQYSKQKIIAIELFSNNNLKGLHDILSNYSYQYFFISKNKVVLNDLHRNDFDNIGRIIDENSNIEIINSVTNNDFYDNTMLIVEK